MSKLEEFKAMSQEDRNRIIGEHLAAQDSEDTDVPRCEECGIELVAPARFCPECSQVRYDAGRTI